MSNRKEGARTQFLRGTLDLMILRSLEALGPLHGYAIAARLEQVSRGALVPNMGTLYPGLMRLEQRDLSKDDVGFIAGQPLERGDERAQLASIVGKFFEQPGDDIADQLVAAGDIFGDRLLFAVEALAEVGDILDPGCIDIRRVMTLDDRDRGLAEMFAR